MGKSQEFLLSILIYLHDLEGSQDFIIGMLKDQLLREI